MKFTRIFVKSGDIAERTDFDTDSLDSAKLSQALEILAQLKRISEPINIGGEASDPVTIGLGEAPIDWMRKGLPDDKFLKIKQGYDNRLGTKRDTEFYLNYRGRGPGFIIIRANDDTLPPGIEGSIAGTRFHDYVFNGVPGPTTAEAKAQEKLHFESVAQEVWRSRPVFYTTSSWGEMWDEYALYFAAVMFLDS